MISDKSGVGVPPFITGQNLFGANPSLAGIADAAIEEKNDIEMTKTAKEFMLKWDMISGGENIAKRALGSVWAHIKTKGEESLPPRLAKLANDRFVALNTRILNEDLSMEEFYVEMKALMGGKPTEQQMRSHFKEASNYFQAAVTSRGFLKGSGQVDANPNFEIVPKTATDRDKLHLRSAVELHSTTTQIAQIASEGNVDVSPASESIDRRFDTFITVLAEGLKAVVGIDLTGQKFLSAGTQEVLGENKDTLRDSLFSELDTTISSIRKDNKVSGLTEDHAVNLSRKLASFKDQLAKATDNQTYLFNFQRVKLAYLYAKFIQGGGGGNAVSNADFDRNFEALFGIYSSDKNIVLADMLRGVASIHNDAQNSIVDTGDREKFTADFGGESRHYASPSSKKLMRRHYDKVGTSLSTPGYQATARYWINALYAGNTFEEKAAQASPLLKAMLVSRGQPDLKRIMRGSVVDPEGERTQLPVKLVPSGGSVDPVTAKEARDRAIRLLEQAGDKEPPAEPSLGGDNQ